MSASLIYNHNFCAALISFIGAVMASVKFTELKKKEVFNLSTGENMGKIVDLIIDEASGNVEKIIVPGKKCGWMSSKCVEINYCCIEKIGKDAVLVRGKNSPPPPPPPPMPQSGNDYDE